MSKDHIFTDYCISNTIKYIGSKQLHHFCRNIRNSMICVAHLAPYILHSCLYSCSFVLIRTCHTTFVWCSSSFLPYHTIIVFSFGHSCWFEWHSSLNRVVFVQISCYSCFSCNIRAWFTLPFALIIVLIRARTYCRCTCSCDYRERTVLGIFELIQTVFVWYTQLSHYQCVTFYIIRIMHVKFK